MIKRGCTSNINRIWFFDVHPRFRYLPFKKSSPHKRWHPDRFQKKNSSVSIPDYNPGIYWFEPIYLHRVIVEFFYITRINFGPAGFIFIISKYLFFEGGFIFFKLYSESKICIIYIPNYLFVGSIAYSNPRRFNPGFLAMQVQLVLIFTFLSFVTGFSSFIPEHDDIVMMVKITMAKSRIKRSMLSLPCNIVSYPLTFP